MKTGDYQDLIRTSSVDLLENLEGESDQSFDSCQSCTWFSSHCVKVAYGDGIGNTFKNSIASFL